MQRREFIATVPALAGAVASPDMKVLNIPLLGSPSLGQWFQTQVTAPATGAASFYDVPANLTLSLRSVCFGATNGAGVANRVPTIIVVWQSRNIATVSGLNASVALADYQVMFGLNCSDSYAQALSMNIPLPDFICPPGSRINFTALNTQAGDIITAVVITGIVYPL